MDSNLGSNFGGLFGDKKNGGKSWDVKVRTQKSMEAYQFFGDKNLEEHLQATVGSNQVTRNPEIGRVFLPPILQRI